MEEPAGGALAAGWTPLVRAERLAHWLDDRYLDPLVGLLLPGVGDLGMSFLGLYLVGVAVHRRLPPVVIARMLLNLGLDSLVGSVPLVGDVFDFTWKANKRNAKLLGARHQARKATVGDYAMVAGAVLLLVIGLALPFVLLGLLLKRG